MQTELPVSVHFSEYVERCADMRPRVTLLHQRRRVFSASRISRLSRSSLLENSEAARSLGSWSSPPNGSILKNLEKYEMKRELTRYRFRSGMR